MIKITVIDYIETVIVLTLCDTENYHKNLSYFTRTTTVYISLLFFYSNHKLFTFIKQHKNHNVTIFKRLVKKQNNTHWKIWNCHNNKLRYHERLIIRKTSYLRLFLLLQTVMIIKRCRPRSRIIM